MKAYYLKNEFESEEPEEPEEELEELDEMEEELEELDEMEEDVRLFQSELKDIERYTPAIITNITKQQPFVPYLVSVLNNVFRREGPGENYKINGRVLKNDVFKIFEEAKDEFDNGWGKIKFGWIPLTECRKL